MKILWTTSSFGIDRFPADWTVVPNPFGRRLSEDEAFEFLSREQPVGMIAGVEPLTRRVLESVPSLKVISRCGVGVDSIDLSATQDLGISVLTTPVATTQSVAELAIGLMLSLLRQIAVVDADFKQGTWNKAKGRLLGDKTVGIFGCGRIGTRVADILASFGCRIIGFDAAMVSHPTIEILDPIHVWEQSDIITLHMPLVADTRLFVNTDTLRRMKSTAILVNTARGGLVDEKALVSALKDGIIAGAALDVYQDEPYSGPMAELGNKVVLTPHIGTAAIEARTAMEEEAVQNLDTALKALHDG